MTANKESIPLPIPKMPYLPTNHMVTSTTPSNVALAHTVKEHLQDVLSVPEGSTISCESKAKSLIQYYQTMIPEDKTVFLKILASDYSINQAVVLHVANQLAAAQPRGPSVLLRSEDRLRHALIPKYQHLFTKISRVHNGVKFLVDLRADLLTTLTSNGIDHDNPHLQSMNTCLRDLLALWFSVGFLDLERITWQSPGEMLQKISEYEAVHPIRNWTDLMRRVGAYRRCFVFMHKSMPGEPVVVLHTALTEDISDNIQTIVTRSRSVEDSQYGTAPNETIEDLNLINTAIFYSITSTQRGLQGVELGNYLIKRVVQELQKDFPSMYQFSSLSPIPGFKDWLTKEINSYAHQYDAGESPEQILFMPEEVTQLEDALGSRSRSMFDALRKSLQTNAWVNDQCVLHALKQPLKRLCARYLFVEKRRGFALNPVANFHLRNGAVMWRINWLGDTSPRGLSVALGLMVNYRYYLNETEENSKNYSEKQIIVASEMIHELVAPLPKLESDRVSPKSESPGSSS